MACDPDTTMLAGDQGICTNPDGTAAADQHWDW